jgi:hypothetical protein
MTEITAENINKLITNDVSQFMKQVMKKKERSQKQKENDAKLKDRLKSYHEQKRQAKSQNVMSVYDNTNEPTTEIQEAKEVQEVQTTQDISFQHINDTLEVLQDVGVVKSKRGRPKKHQYPGPSESIAASV